MGPNSRTSQQQLLMPHLLKKVQTKTGGISGNHQVLELRIDVPIREVSNIKNQNPNTFIMPKIQHLTEKTVGSYENPSSEGVDPSGRGNSISRTNLPNTSSRTLSYSSIFISKIAKLQTTYQTYETRCPYGSKNRLKSSYFNDEGNE